MVLKIYTVYKDIAYFIYIVFDHECWRQLIDVSGRCIFKQSWGHLHNHNYYSMIDIIF